MSLSALWVIANDGYAYADPIIRGKGWAIVFDDTDEVIIEDGAKMTPQEILKSVDIKYTSLGDNGEFEQDGKQKKSYFFYWKGKLNSKFITEHEGKRKLSNITK